MRKFQVLYDPTIPDHIIIEANSFGYDTYGGIEFVRNGETVALIPNGKYIIREVKD